MFGESWDLGSLFIQIVQKLNCSEQGLNQMGWLISWSLGLGSDPIAFSFSAKEVCGGSVGGFVPLVLSWIQAAQKWVFYYTGGG